MNLIGRLIVLTSLASVAVAVGRLDAQPRVAADDDGGVASVIGPDVIIGAMPDIGKYGTVNGISAYAIGTTSCNIGDQVLFWCDADVPGLCTKDQHPVIAQNMYRIVDGRFEQIGMSWVKHGFCALSGTLCGPCQATNCDTLGVGCSDPYSASLNGSTTWLGPRSQINPLTGAFPYPFSAPAAPNIIGRRIQVPIDALDPALNSGAIYIGEGHYIAADDAAAGNANNNGAYRRFTVGAFSSGSYTLSFVGPTVQQRHAIYAWKDHGLGVGIPDPDVVIQEIDVPGDGRFIVGSKVSVNGNGTWSYEYAVFNQNVDRAAGSWSIPVAPGVTVTNQGQTIINHHSGEPYSTDPWVMSASGSELLWSTQTFAQNANANALRWSTMFNFRFVADQPPVTGAASIGLFKPGEESSVSVNVPVPATPEVEVCVGDLNDSGTVDGADLAILLGQWGGSGSGDLDGSGSVDGADLAILLGAWGPCP
ncbi:MAG: hypothetical protein KF724_10000 [Phycisphaeraceae bacterium]|nr:hypothetical protein [Phycisphaeraceae bacterium]